MTIRAREIDSLTILDIDGNVDINSSDIIETVGWFTATGKVNIIINLENVNLVDYSGLSVLAIAFKNVANHKGRMVFINVPLAVLELIKVAKLDTVFPMFDSEETALENFHAKEAGQHHLRRKFTRLDIHLNVSFSYARPGKGTGSFQGQVLNISAAGLYIYTPHTLPLNSHLTLEFSLPQKPVMLDAEGRVSWLADKDIQPHSYPGMGVAFIHLTSEKEREIIDFIDKNVTHRAEPL